MNTMMASVPTALLILSVCSAGAAGTGKTLVSSTSLANVTHPALGDAAEMMVLENGAGVRWELQRTPKGWALGTI